jgi:hypothetical protein
MAQKPVLATDFGHQIDADILAVQPLGLGPIDERPYVLVFLGHARIMLDERQRQPLEIRSLFAFCFCRCTILSKKLAKRRRHLTPGT